MGKDSFAPGRSLLSPAPHLDSDPDTHETNHERATFDRRALDSFHNPDTIFVERMRLADSSLCFCSSLPICRHQWLPEKEPSTNNKLKVTPRRAPTSSRPVALSATTSRRVRVTRLGTCSRRPHLQYGLVSRAILEMSSVCSLHSNAN